MNKRVSSRAIIIEDNKVLLIFRKKVKDGITKEYYVVPGGGQEENETLEETAIRELKEELNVDIEILEYLGKIELDDTISNYYLSKIVKGTPKLGGEELYRMNEYNYYVPRWVDINQLDNIDLSARDIVKKAISLH